MALTKTNEIDMIGTDKETGEVLLSILDELDWSDEGNHLKLLQDKINTYLSFSESGELRSEYPDAIERPVVFEIIGRYEIAPKGIEYIEKIRPVIKNAGFDIRYKHMR